MTHDPSTLQPGDTLRLTADIWDDGEDHHPASWIARRGDTVIVRTVRPGSLGVAHTGATGAFTIYPSEYERLPAHAVADEASCG